MKEPMFAAFAKPPTGPSWHVTLYGQVFLAPKGLMEFMLERMRDKHPGVEFYTEEVS